ncbi:3692_t:CDS:2 [Funneliformis geosporum]|uniref:19761_t:CDS:1 n=1 Tax=Funneliformis geosporum TaxID=1117311 RepID=A0A9W4WUY0_9GLOM|nr:19761_t:CDS:2 [Funneliformis geosporum]CAI2188130.1 3692_t:CDS:2 [Funneliformis geosporum]
MTTTLNSSTHLNFVSPNYEGVHSYFKKVEAQNWQIKHYLSYRLKEDEIILPWTAVYDDWQKSLNVLVKNRTKQIPGSVHGFCSNLLEIDDILKDSKDLYEEFHEQYLNLQISERIQLVDKSLFSSLMVSKHFRKVTSGKKRSHGGKDKISMKIRNTHGVLTKDALDPSNNSHLAPSLDENDNLLLTSSSQVTSDILAKKLVKVGKGIARYNVIYLPECNKNDLIRATFEEEWQTFENFFNKAEEEITSKISSPIKKVENILNKYREALDKATDGAYVELDSVMINYSYQDGYKFRRDWLEYWVNNVYCKFLICFQLSRHVLNDKSSSEYQYRDWFVNLLLEDLFLDINSLIRLSTGEVENMHRKSQKNLSKLPEDRRQIGWYHDGILTVNINGVEEYIGILEVVGNAIVEDHVKMIADRDKILKAMRLAIFQLEQTLRNNGIIDEKQLQNNLETFGILVDRRDFIIYAMHYYDGVYLVDETDLSFIIPNTPMQLYLIEDIIKKLLSFRARVEYLNTRIKTLLRDKTSASRSLLRRTTTAVDVSPGISNSKQHSARINAHKSSAKK